MASGMPERQQADCEGIRVLGEEHPRAFGLVGQAISQSGNVLLEFAPDDRPMTDCVAPAPPSDLGSWIAPLLEKVAEGAHPSRFSTTKLERLRMDWKTRWFSSGSSLRVTP